MEKELTEFKIEVLTQLAVINSKLDGYPETKKISTEANERSKKNEQEIKELKDNNKWAFRTSVGAIITSAIGIIFLFIKLGMGVN